MDKYINTQIEKNMKEMERVRVEMADSQDSKQEQMNGKFERELFSIRKEYEKALHVVSNMGNNLKKMFSEKGNKIKETCANFFSKIDTQVESNARDVLEMSKIFKEWQVNTQGPTQNF